MEKEVEQKQKNRHYYQLKPENPNIKEISNELKFSNQLDRDFVVFLCFYPNYIKDAMIVLVEDHFLDQNAFKTYKKINRNLCKS